MTSVISHHNYSYLKKSTEQLSTSIYQYQYCNHYSYN